MNEWTDEDIVLDRLWRRAFGHGLPATGAGDSVRSMLIRHGGLSEAEIERALAEFRRDVL